MSADYIGRKGKGFSDYMQRRRLRQIREGVTILLIEQNAKLALEVSSRGYVMESGEITLHGDASSLLHDPKVRAAYLGETA